MNTTASERATGGLVGAAGRAVQRLFSRPSAPLPAKSRAARAASAEKPFVSSLDYAGADATANAPAASWEEWQRWAARAPHGQKRERQETLRQLTTEMLRREVGRD